MAKSIRHAHGLNRMYLEQSAVARAAGEAKIREADRLECEAWNAIMFCGGPAQPSPTIGRALNAGYDFLEVQCKRCDRRSLVDLKQVRRPISTEVWKLEGKLDCTNCRRARWKPEAFIVGLTSVGPGREPTRQARRQKGRDVA